MYALSENFDTEMDKLKVRGGGEIVTIFSRFGELHADMVKSVFFPKGILGFPENLHFSVMNFPNNNEALGAFKILQCLNDHSISIPVLPAGYSNSFIDEADMQECLEDVEVSKENLGLLFVVTSQKLSTGDFRLYINTKAPIVIDTSMQMAIQYVFTNNKYSIRQPLDDSKN